MNEYGYRDMMNDYVYLEEVGRRVKDWGGEIVKGGFDMADRKGKGRESAVSMRGGRAGRNAGGKGSGKSKRDILKLQLEARDIYMELLPIGMERRKLNQSSWDFKSQSAWLTIEFVLHPPHNPLGPPLSPLNLLLQRNSLSTPLRKLIESHIEDRLQKAAKASTKPGGDTTTNPLPDWIHDLFPSSEPDDPDPPSLPLFLIRVSPEITQPNNKHRSYRSLAPNDPLLTSLRGIPFIEFPTIEVVDPDSVSEGSFNGVILQENSTDTANYHSLPDRSPKRRKLTVDKKAMTGLLSGYGSSGSGSGSDEEDEKDRGKSALEGLGGYDSSNDEGRKDGENRMHVDNTDSDEDSHVELDAAALEELVKLARAAGGGEDDEVDWDDSDGE
ncbi:Box C/D snoRNA accumulation [Marasmius crinis-equi]|uniref:Box C/D snoRNA accumulation n=1 Tax=Marasmius crinis-equi TaxID=585013 RepID=A0ABR3FZ26_9AGAR